MGLDFNGSDARWAYSGFNRFRERLAAIIGIKLREMEGFGGTGDWNKVKDPIVPFLFHSDCEGELSPEECKTTAPRLKELVSLWSDDDYDKQQALLLVKGMKSCARRKKPLIFC